MIHFRNCLNRLNILAHFHKSQLSHIHHQREWRPLISRAPGNSAMCTTCSGAPCFRRLVFYHRTAQPRAKHPMGARLWRPASHKPPGEDRTTAFHFQYQISSSATPGRGARRPSWPSPAGRSPGRPGWPLPPRGRIPEAQSCRGDSVGTAVPSSWSRRQEVMNAARRPGSDGSAGRTERPRPPGPGLLPPGLGTASAAPRRPSATPGCSGLSWRAAGRPAIPVPSSRHPGPPQASPPPQLPSLSLPNLPFCWRTKPSFPLHGGEVPRARASFVMVSAAPAREQLQGAGFSQPSRLCSSPRIFTLVLWHFDKASWLKTHALKIIQNSQFY